MRKQVYQFSVQGDGHFPMDMLRRDECFPANQSDVEHIEFFCKGEPRTVELRGIAKPTPERWQSFGWRVLMSQKL